MKSLHSIIVRATQAWTWVNVMGGNGQRISGFSHLHLQHRGAPTNTYYRQYWTPWTDQFGNAMTTAEILTPLCRKLRSVSRLPSIRPAYKSTYTRGECPDCLAIAGIRGITPAYREDLIKQDPWTQIPHHLRKDVHDPVSLQ